MPRSATFLASNLADSLAEHVKLEANYKVSRVDALITQFKSLAVSNKASNVALDRVDIFAHAAIPGQVLECDRSDPVASCPPYGAYGISMGRDILNLGRTDVFEYLKGAFSPEGVINLIACAVAGVIPDPQSRAGPAVWSGNGIKYCQSIAEKAGCRVRASPDIQLCKYDEETNWFGFNVVARTNYDPGDWEGAVYIFEPGIGHRVER